MSTQPGDPPVSLFVLQSSGSQFPARKAEQQETRPTPPPEPPPRPPGPGPACCGEALQLGSEQQPPHYEPGVEQWVELVGVLPPHLLLPQQRVVFEPQPGLSARASPDLRVRIHRMPQVLVFGTALKVGGGGQRTHGGGGAGAGRGRASGPASRYAPPPSPGSQAPPLQPKEGGVRCLCPCPPKFCQSFHVLPQELGPRCRSCKPGLWVEVGYPVPAPKVLSVSGSVLSTDPSSGSTPILPGKPFWFPEDPQPRF